MTQAEQTAQENVNRYGELQAELSSLKATVERTTTRIDKLPTLFARATLEDDFDRELELKQEYATLKEQRAEAQERIPEVEQELRALSGPNEVIHELQIWQRQFRAVSRAAASPLADLNGISKEINAAINKATVPFEQVLQDRRGEEYGWQSEISWSPEWRAAVGGNESHAKLEAHGGQL